MNDTIEKFGVFAISVKIAHSTSRISENRKNIEKRKQTVNSLIGFELTQHIRPRYINVQTDRQTDRQTDGRLAIAIPCFALSASRGNYLCVS